MELSQSSQRMHPLVAGAAASVMLVSLLGAAAITGVLPTSHGTVPPAQPVASATTPAAMPAPAPAVAVAETAPAPRAAQPVVQHRVVHHTTTVHTQPAVYAQADTPRPAPVYTQPAPAPVQTAQNSPVGIGVGAVVGGLLGSQVGGGNGRTLATIAGAIGGGYMGNEIAKRNP